jgi:hypothetical protein
MAKSHIIVTATFIIGTNRRECKGKNSKVVDYIIVVINAGRFTLFKSSDNLKFDKLDT